MLSLLLVTWLAVEQSRSAFGDTTQSSDNAVSTGTVVLDDNLNGAAMFDVSNLGPGDAAVGCIEVIYEGTLDAGSPVRMYSTSLTEGAASPTDLATYLDLRIDVGTAGSTCGEFNAEAAPLEAPATLAGFNTTRTSWDTGLSTRWTPAAAESGEMRPFRITLTVQDVPEAQGTTTSPEFTWEVRS